MRWEIISFVAVNILCDGKSSALLQEISYEMGNHQLCVRKYLMGWELTSLPSRVAGNLLWEGNSPAWWQEFS